MPPFTLLILVTASFFLLFSRELFPSIEKEVVLRVEKSQSSEPKKSLEKKPTQPDRASDKTTSVLDKNNQTNPSDKTATPIEKYRPRYTLVEIDPTNYGERYGKDIHGKLLTNKPLVVLHETVNSLQSAIHTFQTRHINENQQVSYHAIVALDGTIVYLVPAEKRAFGAGNSAFINSTGEIETVQTNPLLRSSVNNFAYHLSLETPPDGRNNQPTHSGYTESQYHSLAWLIAMSEIPDDRITTHQAVDRNGDRYDPRSFDRSYFLKLLDFYRGED
jgi:hypothetical protein